MPKTAMIRVRVESELKSAVENVLKDLGMSATEAITQFYTQVAIQRGLPFDVKLSNSHTVEALQQAEAGVELLEHLTLEDLKARV